VLADLAPDARKPAGQLCGNRLRSIRALDVRRRLLGGGVWPARLDEGQHVLLADPARAPGPWNAIEIDAVVARDPLDDG
jgi:hypothetical protein